MAEITVKRSESGEYMQDKTHYEVVIIGAEIAGLSCAWTLHHNNVPLTVLERSDRPGGRIKTDGSPCNHHRPGT